ncbi:hypothetical protein KCU61_g584, partial [Aureobasidium melanogenum]
MVAIASSARRRHEHEQFGMRAGLSTCEQAAHMAAVGSFSSEQILQVKEGATDRSSGIGCVLVDGLMNLRDVSRSWSSSLSVEASSSSGIVCLALPLGSGRVDKWTGGPSPVYALSQRTFSSSAYAFLTFQKPLIGVWGLEDQLNDFSSIEIAADELRIGWIFF